MGIFRKVGGRLVDTRVDKWMSWEYLGKTTEYFKNMVVDIATPPKATYTETFDEAMQRMELSEKDLTQCKKRFVFFIAFYVIAAVSIIGYALYFAFAGKIAPALISFCIAVYCFANAFRYHFWLFQIKHRKLGCTFKEWFNSKIHDEPRHNIVTRESSQIKDTERKAK